MRRLACCFAVAAVVVALGGCGFVVVHGAKKAYNEYTREEREVDVALSRYRLFLMRGEFDRAAEMFDPTAAELSRDDQAPVIGRDAIRAFLKSFTEYKVVEFEVKVTSTTTSGSKASQQGTYRQKLTTPDGKPVAVEGSFEAEWSQQAKGSWLLRRMHTSTKAPSEG